MVTKANNVKMDTSRRFCLQEKRCFHLKVNQQASSYIKLWFKGFINREFLTFLALKMEIFYVQLFTLLILLLCNFLAGLLPFIALRLVDRFAGSGHYTGQRNRVLSFFLHLGGGVFMSVCLLILMPESREQFEQKDHQKHFTSRLPPIGPFEFLSFRFNLYNRVLMSPRNTITTDVGPRNIKPNFCNCGSLAMGMNSGPNLDATNPLVIPVKSVVDQSPHVDVV
ncbi:uncharacterized protein TNCV_4604901 [Trichonephila clavipes]|nr:uncharacterized protein TNCV_4604901 [Trichonephila clavipes]